MKKVLLCIPLIFLLNVSISFLVYGDQTKDKGKNDHYINLERKYKIHAKIHFRRYGMQDILEVPEIRLGDKEKILTYRTEFHNGTENGCLKVYNRVEDKKLIPFFVLE